MVEGKIALNIGAGAIDMDRYDDCKFIVHLDACYRKESSLTSSQIDSMFEEEMMNGDSITIHNRVSADVFEFIECFPYKFNYIYAERIFEHMEYVNGEIGRLLEGINRITTPDAKMEIVVPNIDLVTEIASNFGKEPIDEIEATNQKLIINSELNNIRADPHCSSWNPNLAKSYINSEGTWKVETIAPKIIFAGRDIYMRVVCNKPQTQT